MILMLESSNSLEFAHGAARPGSPEERIEKLVVGLVSPTELVAAYMNGVVTHKVSDLVLVIATHDAEVITAWPRSKYIESALSKCTKEQLAAIRLAQESAHRVVKLPAERVAFWLVVEVRTLPAPIMTVLSMPYDVEAAEVN
jgi:hypothetical protein